MGTPIPHVGVQRGNGLVARFGSAVIVVASTDAEDGPFVPALLAALEDSADDGDIGAAELAWKIAALIGAHREAAADFGLVVRVAGGHLVLLHGSVRALVTDAAGTLELTGRNALTWVDHIVSGDFETIAVTLADAGEIRAAARSDLRGGMVTGDGLVLRARRVPAAARPAPSTPAEEPAQAPEPAESGTGLQAAQLAGPVARPEAETLTSTQAYTPTWETDGRSETPPSNATPETDAESSKTEKVSADFVAQSESIVRQAADPSSAPASATPRPVIALPPVRTAQAAVGTPGAPPTRPSSPTTGGHPIVPPAVPGPHIVPPPAARPFQRRPAEETQVVESTPRALVADDGHRILLDRDYVFGRDPGHDQSVIRGMASPIVVRDPDQLISRVQMYLSASSGVVSLWDPGSSNGTYIAAPGAKDWVRVGSQPAVLPVGWSMRMGRRVYTYVAPEPRGS